MTERSDEALAPYTTLGMGGPARRFVEATTRDEVAAALAHADAVGERALVLAGGSNVVLPDVGFDGTVVHLATRGVELSEDGTLKVEAGEPWDDVVALAVSRGCAGIEALSGIPGSTGATPVQNVGAYGQEVAETITSVDVLDRTTGEVGAVPAVDCGFGYRASRFKYQDRYVVLGVTFRLMPSMESRPVRYAELARTLGVAVGETAPLADVRAAVIGLRRGKGMVLDQDDADSRSVGSFFTNPVLDKAEYDALCERAGVDVPHFVAGDGVKVPAAWLIERAGFGKGYGDGRVGISSKHTLALVNRGGGTAAELLALAREIRDGVLKRFGVLLRPEPVLVGVQI